jgi:hypothetical protein
LMVTEVTDNRLRLSLERPPEKDADFFHVVWRVLDSSPLHVVTTIKELRAELERVYPRYYLETGFHAVSTASRVILHTELADETSIELRMGNFRLGNKSRSNKKAMLCISADREEERVRDHESEGEEYAAEDWDYDPEEYKDGWE